MWTSAIGSGLKRWLGPADRPRRRSRSACPRSTRTRSRTDRRRGNTARVRWRRKSPPAGTVPAPSTVMLAPKATDLGEAEKLAGRCLVTSTRSPTLDRRRPAGEDEDAVGGVDVAVRARRRSLHEESRPVPRQVTTLSWVSDQPLPSKRAGRAVALDLVDLGRPPGSRRTASRRPSCQVSRGCRRSRRPGSAGRRAGQAEDVRVEGQRLVVAAFAAVARGRQGRCDPSLSETVSSPELV